MAQWLKFVVLAKKHNEEQTAIEFRVIWFSN